MPTTNANLDILDSDVLRWMAQADEAAGRKRDPDKRDKKERFKRSFSSWLGNRRPGEWIREDVATDVSRTFEVHTKGKDENGKACIVTQQRTQTINQFDGYRPKLDGEKETRKSFFWRGARVWRN